jgi:ATP-binding cassette, subfamily F, member 3
MATIFEAVQLAKHYTNEATIEDISFKVNQGEKIGLVGENGCGKSTLIKLIAGLEAPSAGHMACARGMRIGYLAQELHYTAGNSVEEELLEVFAQVRQLGQRLEDMQAAMAAPDQEPAVQQRLLATYGPLAETFEHDGGYTYMHRIDTVLHGLGLAAKRQRRVEALSGGEKNVMALARILLQEPNILLLDEPANHLDFKGLEWLERFLLDYPGSVLLVSHNRYLLDRVTTQTFEIEALHLTVYPGNYSAYRDEKSRRLLRQQEQFQAQQKEIRRLEAMIKRFERWGQMSDDPRIPIRRRNKERQIERMDKIERPELEKKSINPRFDAERKSGRIALELIAYSRQIGEKCLFADADLHIGYGERVGLLGANGSGKSTLFRDIVAHGAWDNACIRLGPQVRLGYYSQEHETLDMDRTVIDEMRQQPGLLKEDAWRLLMNFMFSWQDMDQTVGTLSGGQKSRLQLAKLMAADINFLLMDEPTNHLDTYAQERVEEALEAFAGTMLVISHDRYFLDRIVQRIVEVDNPNLRDHPGNFTAYWQRKTAAEKPPEPPSSKTPIPGPSIAKTGARPTPAEIQEKSRLLLEDQLESLEEEKEELAAEIATAYEAEEYDLGEELGRDLQRLEEEIDQLYSAWEALVAQSDQNS